jgi:hypothetical protein
MIAEDRPRPIDAAQVFVELMAFVAGAIAAAAF